MNTCSVCARVAIASSEHGMRVVTASSEYGTDMLQLPSLFWVNSQQSTVQENDRIIQAEHWTRHSDEGLDRNINNLTDACAVRYTALPILFLERGI